MNKELSKEEIDLFISYGSTDTNQPIDIDPPEMFPGLIVGGGELSSVPYYEPLVIDTRVSKCGNKVISILSDGQIRVTYRYLNNVTNYEDSELIKEMMGIKEEPNEETGEAKKLKFKKEED